MSLYTHQKRHFLGSYFPLGLDLIRNACTQGNTKDGALVSQIKERMLEMSWCIPVIFPILNVFIMFSSQKYAKQILHVFACFTKENKNFIQVRKKDRIFKF